MPAVIRSIGTAVPQFTVEQSAVRDLFLAQPGLGRLGERLVRAAFDGSAVERRGTVLEDVASERPGPFVDVDGVVGAPSTGFRNDRFRAEAPALFVSAARRALERTVLAPESVTHVVTVSCTGFTQPGPDADIVRELGLRRDVFRHHIGFMGCAAAFPALRVAEAFCAADPDAVVLVVCAELCTLHVRTSSDPDQIVSNSVFADGAAAAVLTSDLAAGASGLRIDAFGTSLVEEGAPDMAWNIGDAGFEMVLSTRVPKLVQAHVRRAIAPVVDRSGRSLGDFVWAVHPGGRAILDRVELELGLSADALWASRDVLREHGNMSSATILFVLERLLGGASGRGVDDGAAVLALAFGPGLTVESAALQLVGA